MNDASPQLPAPSAQGTLAKTPLPHLLVYVHERKLTGTLELRHPDGPTAIFVLHGGAPAKARTSDAVAYLGVVLHEMGFVTDAQLNASLVRLAKERRLHGEILLESGVITVDQLKEGLRRQIVHKLEHLFAWPATTKFAYYDQKDALASIGGRELVTVDPYPVVWSSIRHEPSWEHVQAALARIAAAPVRLTRTAEPNRFGFSTEEAAAVDLLRTRPMRVNELAGCRILNAKTTQLLMYCLAITRQIELLSDAEAERLGTPAAQPIATPFARVQLQPRAVPTRASGSGQWGAAVEEHVAPTNADGRAATPPPPAPPASSHVPLGSRSGIPAVRVPADPPPHIEDAAPATSSAPPRSVQPSTKPASSAQPSAPPHGDAAPISSRIPVSTKSPSMTFSAVSSSPPGSSNAASRPPPSSKSPSSSTLLAADLAARRKRIIDRAGAIKGEDYFTMLGLERDANEQHAQTAFFMLAKVWHPDRLPPSLADVRDECSKVFSHLSEAHQTLTDPARRQDYVRLLTEGGATPEDQDEIAAVVDAAMTFQKAEVCVKRGDWALAEQLCQKARGGDPRQADYLALLAWIIAQKPESQTPAATLEIIAMLDEALRLGERCARAYFYRGMLHKRMQHDGPALSDFKRAVELSPQNIDAIREVRLYRLRKERGASPSSDPPPSSSRTPSTPKMRAQKNSSRPPPPGRKDAPSSLGGLFGKLFKK